MATDPVCGMNIEEQSAAGKLMHEGTSYYFCSAACLNKFKANPMMYTDVQMSREAGRGERPAYMHAETAAVPLKMAVGQSHVHAPGMTAAAPKPKSAKDLAKDPICGMVVEKSKSLKTERAGRAYYFCSSGCQRTFESPEAELKSMRTRVTIALTGVLALAIMRAGAFIALATGATLLTWVPIPALPWFTWGVWLFLLVTPVQFIGGWSFYVGAFNALRNRSINMDLLIALGTSVAYFYSVAVLFFPQVLPVKVEERDVYFEVSAVIIAFVLLGKYMEEIIKKHSSAAVRKLLDLKPATAQVVRAGVEMEVPVESVMVDET